VKAPRGRRKLFGLTASSFRSLSVVAVALGVSLSFAGSARANGRFPNAQQVRELGSGSLVVAGTYGLLVTTNGGRDFAHVCESEMFGRPAGNFTMDPLLEVAPDGSFVTGSVQAARVSRDLGCAFETVESLPRNWEFFGLELPPGAENGRVIDLCRRGAGAETPLLALVAIVDEAGFPLEHRIYEARVGTTFVPIGAPIETELADTGLTLDAAPSDPDRLYLTATLAGAPVLVRSADAGQTWESVPVGAADADTLERSYLAAVSPTDPDRIYVRVQRRRLTDAGYYLWDDSLLVSDDAGNAFSEPLRHDAALLGFALANDGEIVLAGYGDPRADPALSSRDDLGIYAADAALPAGAIVFERIVSDLDVSCLYATATGLYACATELDPLGADSTLEPDFHLGLHRGAELPTARADFAPLLKLRDVRGPAPRSDDRVSACDAEWMVACPQFFACENDPSDFADGALVCGNGAGGEGSGGAPRRGAEPEFGCGCKTSRGGSVTALGWMFAFLLGWWHRFRARCRR
jgi:hypothetical protein